MSDYDFIIIGGGPAALSAAIYAIRFNLKTLVIAKQIGGLVTSTHLIENYPGFATGSGKELFDKFLEHAKYFKTEMVNAEVRTIKKVKGGFIVKTDKKEYTAKTIMFATGGKHRKLKVPGEEELYGRGVSYCATCDGPFFKNKIVGVVGGSDSAAKEALYLSSIAKQVYIIYRKEKIRAEPINTERVNKTKNITIVNNSNVKKIVGEKKLESVELDKEYKGSETLQLDGLFIEIGYIPLSDLAKSIGVKLNQKAEIIIDRQAKTNLDGVFAAGDVTDNPFKQVITAAAEGSAAAFSAHEFVEKNS